MATLAEELILRLELWAQQQGGREDAALIIEYEWSDKPVVERTRYAKRSDKSEIYAANASGSKWTESEVNALKRERLTVVRVRQIARRTGRTYEAVYQKMVRLGLTGNPDL
jgi:hypothetical protein